jgi:hypothetical protein
LSHEIALHDQWLHAQEQSLIESRNVLWSLVRDDDDHCQHRAAVVEPHNNKSSDNDPSRLSLANATSFVFGDSADDIGGDITEFDTTEEPPVAHHHNYRSAANRQTAAAACFGDSMMMMDEDDDHHDHLSSFGMNRKTVG